jgi:uncharacterized membrane protein
MRYVALLSLTLAACSSDGGSQVPGDKSDKQPFAGIGADEALQLTGTEPFWGGTVAGNSLTYTTPENPEGAAASVERFPGRGGLSFSGELEGARFDLMVTPGPCSDGMSDRSYPFTVTLKLGEEVRNGCAWSQQHPFSGDETP